MFNLNLNSIIEKLSLNGNEIIQDFNVFKEIFEQQKNPLPYYANYLIIKDLYLPQLERLKADDDICQNIYDAKINEIHAFFTLWFKHKRKQYTQEQPYAFKISPGVIFNQSQFILDGDLLTKDTTLTINIVCANLLRQSIEILLLESCGYPINEKHRSPSFSRIVEALKNNCINVKFGISEDYKRYISNDIKCLDLLKFFYDYLSGILHKNMSGVLFSWQLDFIQNIISGAFQKTFPRVDILEPKLSKESKFYTDIKCKRGTTL